MSKVHACIDDKMAEWIAKQKLFFVATAPLSADGHVNCSPKGGDAFRVLGSMEAAYQDLTGSGAETAAHLRENGRIVILFCAFEGAPKIVRLHGVGSIIAVGDPHFAEIASHFPANTGTRAIVHVQVTRVSDSCGFSVPFFDYREHRDTLDRWADSKGVEEVQAYRDVKNLLSIDGLPAFDASSAE